MKIGILTFHWATNYGAILQCYALQTYLESIGHTVEIINYKPLKYDTSIRKYLKYPKIFIVDVLNFREVYKSYVKESRLCKFRKQYLHISKRLYSEEEVSLFISKSDFDVLISGSDQILNPYYAEGGEGRKTSTYFLNFSTCALKLGYAVSFGCEKYPTDKVPEVIDWIQNFDRIGVRENTGLSILNQLRYEKTKLVLPDPTILFGKALFDSLNVKIEKGNYIYGYMLRGEKVDRCFLENAKMPIRFADIKAGRTSLIKWIEDITCSSSLITNSYHGMIMAILSHTPFVVLLEKGKLAGMNDRFYTLLSHLNLENRIADNTQASITSVLESNIEWEDIDKKLSEFREVGGCFLDF